MIETSQLEPVFQILLPTLENAGIDYWVYGGVGVAAVAGKFIRYNRDVDIFVKDKDYDQAKITLEEVCNRNSNFTPKHCNPLNIGIYSRPKLEIKIDNIERLSVVPLYLNNNSSILVFGNGPQEFSNKIFEKADDNEPNNDHVSKTIQGEPCNNPATWQNRHTNKNYTLNNNQFNNVKENAISNKKKKRSENKEYLASYIAEQLEDDHSLGFFRKVVDLVPENLIHQALSEVKNTHLTGKIKMLKLNYEN